MGERETVFVSMFALFSFVYVFALICAFLVLFCLDCLYVVAVVVLGGYPVACVSQKKKKNRFFCLKVSLMFIHCKLLPQFSFFFAHHDCTSTDISFTMKNCEDFYVPWFCQQWTERL